MGNPIFVSNLFCCFSFLKVFKVRDFVKRFKLIRFLCECNLNTYKAFFAYPKIECFSCMVLVLLIM